MSQFTRAWFVISEHFFFNLFLRKTASIIKMTEKKRQRAMNDAAIFLSKFLFFTLEYIRREENSYYAIGIND
jgi:hypothetical protein